MTEDDWLDACADQPDDDLRRYAFADWLEERGDHERAEFIRIQVGHSRQDLAARDQTTAHRAAELLVRRRLDWLGPLVELANATVWRFPRGLPERLDVHAQALGDAGVARLAISPHCHRLVTLDLSNNNVGTGGATTLATAPQLKRLTTLLLHQNSIGDAGATALATSRYLNHLAILDLSGNRVGEAGAVALATSRRTTQLLELHLWDNKWTLGPAGRAALVRAFDDRVHF